MLISSLPFFLAYGGVQAFRLSKELRKRKVGIFIVSKTHAMKNRTWYITKEIDGVTCYMLNCRSRISRFFEYRFGINPEYYLKASLFLAMLRRNYDIVQINGLPLCHIIIAIPLKLLRKKKLARMTTPSVDDFFSIKRTRFIGFLLIRVLSYFDGFVSISSEFTETYISSGKFLSLRKLFEIPNGIDTTEFYPVNQDEKLLLREKLGLPTYKTIVSFVGWISENKGVHILVKAWKSVVENRRDALLILVGPTKDERFLKTIHSIIKSSNLEENVFFTGFVNGARVREFLQASDIFVFLSRSEGHSNVLLEAESCGLPCIVTDAPWARDTLKNGVEGYLVDRDDLEQVSGLITKLVKSPDLRLLLGENARKKVVNHFHIGMIAEKYIDTYAHVLDNPRPTEPVTTKA
jgi:glycosyltransferase involved in cell wall biosynthesis